MPSMTEPAGTTLTLVRKIGILSDRLRALCAHTPDGTCHSEQVMMLSVIRSVIYCEGGRDGLGFNIPFIETARERGFHPVWYLGVDLSTRRSTIDRELRNDFYRAEIRVVMLTGDDPLDHWAVPELPHCREYCKKHLVYASVATDESWEKAIEGVPVRIQRLSGVNEFRIRLAEDLVRVFNC